MKDADDRAEPPPPLTLEEERRAASGKLPGNRYVRIVRPAAGEFRRTRGNYVATDRSLTPESRFGRRYQRIRRFLLGKPLGIEAESEQRVSKLTGLAVLAPSNVSSSAYATEELLRVVAPAASRDDPATLALVAWPFSRSSRLGNTGSTRRRRWSTSSRATNIGLFPVFWPRRPCSSIRAHGLSRRSQGHRDIERRTGSRRSACRAGHRDDRAARARPPPRHPRGGRDLRGPDVSVHRGGWRADRVRRLSDRDGRRAARRAPTRRGRAHRRGSGDHPAAGPCVRRRRSRDHGHRGRRKRRPQLQGAGAPECHPHSAAHGRDARSALRRPHLPRDAHRDHPGCRRGRVGQQHDRALCLR